MSTKRLMISIISFALLFTTCLSVSSFVFADDDHSDFTLGAITLEDGSGENSGEVIEDEKIDIVLSGESIVITDILSGDSGDLSLEGLLIASGEDIAMVSGDNSGETTEAVSGEDAVVSGEEVKTSGEAVEVSGEEAVSGEVSGEAVVSGEVSGEVVSGDVSGETSGEAVVSGDVSGEVVASGDVVEYKEYDDVKEGTWYYGEVNDALQKGLISGKTEDSFMPKDAVTYEEAGELINQFDSLYGLKSESGDRLVHITIDEEYQKQDITRQDLATIVYEYMKTQGFEAVEAKLEYVDKDAVDYYAQEALTWCNIHKIMVGRPNNEIAPLDVCTRAEVSAILSRLSKLVK